MKCRFPFHMNHIWSIWYVIAMVPLQAYLIHLGLGRYRLYREKTEEKPTTLPLTINAYLTLYYISVPILIVFAISGIFKSGNIVGDNEKFGAQTNRVSRYAKSEKKGKRSFSRAVKAVLVHGPPLPQQLHILAALCQLFAQQLMIAQIYRDAPVASEKAVNTELDFVYDVEAKLLLNLPNDDSGLRGFRGTFQDLVRSSVAPKLLPILMNFSLFGIPLEFVNLIVALFAYCCCYASVFWRVSKWFSFLFSTYLFIHSATIVWTYLAFSILYRIQMINYANAQPDRFGQYLSFSKYLFIYRPEAIVGLFVMTVALMSVAPVAMYTYGYNKFLVNLFNMQNRNATRCQASVTSHSHDFMDNRGRNSHDIRSPQLCCEGYGPHIVAILLLIFIVAVKAPTIYAFMVLYQHDSKPFLASCIVMDIAYLFTWIIFWLILTLKRDWKYKVLHDVGEIISLQSAHKNCVPSSSGAVEGTPVCTKNALIVMHGEQFFVTDDHFIKQAILRHMQKNAGSSANDEVYWLGANGHSPVRKTFVSESAKGTPEMKRLLSGAPGRRSSNEENSTLTAAYHTISRMNQGQKSKEISYDLSTKQGWSFMAPEEITAVGTFGTLQRNSRNEAPVLLGQRQQQQSQKQVGAKSNDYGIVPSIAEAYATVHKPMQREGMQSFSEERVVSGRKNDLPNSTYASYSSAYETYAKIPQQINSSQRYRSDSEFAQSASGATGVTSKEFYSDSFTPRACREQHPIKKTSNLKLSSFNSGTSGNDTTKQTSSQIPPAGSASRWSQQKSAATMQPLNLQWSDNLTYNKTSSISTVSSQQEQSCTPSSTLTSQGSVSNYGTQQTPIPGSPGLGPSQNLYTNYGTGRCTQRPNTGTYGNFGDGLNAGDVYGTLTERDNRFAATGQKQLRVIPANHHGKTGSGSGREDSANYSLTSSNESAENQRNADSNSSPIEYATSVV